MTKSEFLERHQAAGTAFEAASRAYIAAWIELNACDLVRKNGNLAFPAHHHSGFVHAPEVAQHSEFQQDSSAIHARAVERSYALMEQIIKSIEG